MFALSTSAAMADKVDFSRYFKSSTALSAIASALSIVEPCGKPVEFKEEVSKDAVVFSARCAATGSEPITVKINFQKDEEGNLFPDTFDYGH